MEANVVALAGGVGGARLAQGLDAVLSPGSLTVIGNTADDCDLFGLHICPDLDTVMYTLAGLANPATGWGICDDTFAAMEMLGRYGEPTWFRLGDQDLATHVRRTALLRGGQGLVSVTRQLTGSLGVRSHLIPMCEQMVGTVVTTRDGRTLAFQEYFVQRGHRDAVQGVTFAGIEAARAPAEAIAALTKADVVVFCPSNPFVSIAPILAVPGMRDAVSTAHARRIAVSPIVGGCALRGPAADMLGDLGHDRRVRGG